MLEILAMKLFFLASNITLAPPTKQIAAWNAQPAQMQAAYRREAQFVLAGRP
jgi:hypothetical protein